MKILMSGATGLIGSQLKPRLESRGHQIIPLGRKDFPPRAELFKNVNGLIHLAGENVAAGRWTSERKQALRDSRVETAVKIREALHEASHHLNFVMSASGIGFYGDRKAEALSETSPPGDDFLSRLCLEWEAAVDTIPADRHVKFRLGVVMSSEGGFLKQVTPIFKRFGASRLGSGKQWFSWIHIEDVLNIFCRAVETPMDGVYNLTSPNPVTNADLTRALAKGLDVWPSLPVPRFVLRLMYGELGTALLSSQRALPKRLLNDGYDFVRPELNRVLAELL
jgi:uncharacterized protein (TIGR01777 family)